MTRTIFLTMCIAVLTCVCGCHNSIRHEYPHKLVLLDSLCNANSEEAVSVLKDISKDTQSFSKQDKWFYRLLCVKVADKFTDGNISRHEVSKILSYYESSWCDADELSSAYYYMGRCYFSEDNMPMALHYYRQCISCLSDEKCRLSGNVNFQTGYLFLEQGFPNYALPYFRKSLEIEQALNDTAMAVYCLQKIAYSYQDIKSDSCLLYFERALRLADHTRQDWLINEIKNSLATYYLQKGSYGKAKELALPVLRTMEDENPGKNSFYSVVGLSCYGTGQIDSARYYFHKLYDLGDVESKTVASKYLYRIYAKSGDTAKALHYLDEYDQNDDSLKAIKVEASVARMNALFNYTMYKERNEYLEASRMRMIFISVVALLLVALLLVCIYVRMRMLKQRSERQVLNLQRYRIETAERRKEFVERKDAEITELRSKLQNLENNGSTAEELMSRKKVLESRRELAESKQDLEDKRKVLFVSSPVFPLVCKRVRENSPLNTEEQNLLDHTLLELMPDFIVNLKSVTYVSIQDIRMCALIKFCDLHSNEVASLLGRHKSTISKAKKKLLTKFAGSDVSDMSFEEFIRNI